MRFKLFSFLMSSLHSATLLSFCMHALLYSTLVLLWSFPSFFIFSFTKLSLSWSMSILVDQLEHILEIAIFSHQDYYVFLYVHCQILLRRGGEKQGIEKEGRKLKYSCSQYLRKKRINKWDHPFSFWSLVIRQLMILNLYCAHQHQLNFYTSAVPTSLSWEGIHWQHSSAYSSAL